MEYLYISFRVVFPLFLFMGLGYAVRAFGFMDRGGFDKLNKLVFRIFMPVFMFLNIYDSNISETFDLTLVLLGLAATAISFVVLVVLVPRIVEKREDRSVVIQGMFRSNFVVFGVSIAKAIYPDTDIGVVSVLAAFVVPFYNVMSVILFEMYRGRKADVKNIIKEVFKNPLVLAGILGITFVTADIPIPGLLRNSMDDLAAMATPLALLCLGGTFAFKGLQADLKNIIITSFGRLIVVPAVFLGAAVLLGYRNLELVAFLAIFASPTSSSSFPMAQEMGGNGRLAGEIVVVSSSAAVFTIFLWVYLLKFMVLI